MDDESTTELPDLWRAVLPVVDLFESWDVPFHLGGSVASSFLGMARSTLDADLVADLKPIHGSMLLQALQETYYLLEDRIFSAIRQRKSFNLIHLATMFKVDIFVQPRSPFDRQVMARRISLKVRDIDRSLHFCTAEDIILHKLLWFQEGNQVAQRQWRDVQGVLRLQAESLDRDYLKQWARELGISDLLGEALEERDASS